MLEGTIGVAVATFGDRKKWSELAGRAMASARATDPDDIVYIHGPNIAEARNEAARRVQTEYVVFLDADDELAPGYVDAMRTQIADGANVLVQPKTQYIVTSNPDAPTADPFFIDPRPRLYEANWMVIGTMCNRDLMLEVGGFDPSLPIYEDWDLWQKLHYRTGAAFRQADEAVYRVHVREGSRNDAELSFQRKWYRIIRNRYDRTEIR